MSADHELAEAYQEWRRLAEAEGEAIRACDWGLVSACQKALQHLQTQITWLSPAASDERAKLGHDGIVREKTLNATVQELIQQERSNQTLLDAVQAVARTKLEELNRAGRNLKQIQRSYGLNRPAAWSSFS